MMTKESLHLGTMIACVFAADLGRNQPLKGLEQTVE
jgi:hypothetical protein